MHRLTEVLNKMPGRSAVSDFNYWLDSQTSDWGFDLTTVGYERVAPQIDYPLQGHPSSHSFKWSKGRELREYQLIYLSSGAGQFETRRSSSDVSAGDILLLCKGDWHRYKPDYDKGWESYWMGFRGPYVEEYVRDQLFLRRESAPYHVGLRRDLVDRFRELIELSKTRSPLLRVLALSCVLQIFAYAMVSTETHARGRRSNAVIEAAIAFVEENACTDIDFKQLARSLNLSYSRFRSLFKQHTGRAPKMFLLDKRIERASRLLKRPDLDVKGVAYQTGFRTSSYFCRVFRNRTGVTPSSEKIAPAKHKEFRDPDLDC